MENENIIKRVDDIKNKYLQTKNKYDLELKDQGLIYFIFDFDQTITQVDVLQVLLTNLNDEKEKLIEKVFGSPERKQGLHDLFSFLKTKGKIIIASRSISLFIITLLQKIDLLKYVDAIYDRQYFTLFPANNKINQMMKLGWFNNHIFYADDDRRNHENIFGKNNFLINKKTKCKYVYYPSPSTGMDPREVKKYIEEKVIPFFNS